MTMRARKGLVIARTRTSGNYGDDAAPNAQLNSILVSGLTPSGDLPQLERNFLRASLARLPHAVGRKLQSLQFSAELKASPAAGMRPQWGPLARAAGFQETVTGTVTSIRTASFSWEQVGATEEYQLDSSPSGDPGLADPSTIREDGQDMTRGTVGSLRQGQFGYGDPNTLGYNSPVVRLSDGADPDGKALDFVEHVAATKIEYAPRSAGFEDATMHGYPDGILHKLRGSFGTWEMNYRSGQYALWNFNITGLWDAPTTLAIPSGSNFHDIVPPIGESMVITLDAYTDAVVRSLVLRGGVGIAERGDLNSPEGLKGLDIPNRSITGEMVVEAVLESEFAYWGKAAAGTTIAFSGKIGTSPSSLKLESPKMQIGAPAWTEENDIRLYRMPLFFNQDVADADDDFLITLPDDA